MRERNRIFESVINSSELDPVVQPKLPVVEIAGDKRMLIENHKSVIGYSAGEVVVKVKYGRILIKGCGLQLARLRKEQLVVTGRIDCVMLCREGQGEVR